MYAGGVNAKANTQMYKASTEGVRLLSHTPAYSQHVPCLNYCNCIKYVNSESIFDFLNTAVIDAVPLVAFCSLLIRYSTLHPLR